MTWKRVATAAVLIPVVVGLVLWGSTIVVALVFTYQTRQTQIELSKRGEALMKSGQSDHK